MKRFLPLRRLYFLLRDEICERQMLARVASRQGNGESERARRYVSYYAYAGLGNRLRAHLIALAYSLRTGRELVVSWEKNSHLMADFGELFEWQGEMRACCRSVLRVPYAKGDLSDQGDRSEFESDLVLFKARWQFVDYAYLMRSVEGLLPQILRRLQPAREIARLAADIKRAWPQNVIGIHVRRGDFVTHTNQAVPIEKYIQETRRALLNLPEGTHIYLASDATEGELRPLYAAFEGKVEKHPSRPRQTVEGARDALRDLLLLSSTSQLILTKGSTFGEFAALYGNVPKTFAKSD